MISETAQNLAIALVLVTLLGAIMGYFVASILATKRATSDVQRIQSENTLAKAELEAKVKSLSRERAEFKNSLNLANERAASATEKEESLDVHSEFLSQRIQSLESQVASYEEQQIRLQRDFATYKANKARELDLARINPESWSQTADLPVLNRRIPPDESLKSRVLATAQASDTDNRDRHGNPDRDRAPSRAPSRSRRRRHTELSLPLSRELDIPALAESELPDSVEELEFELADYDTDGGHSSG